LKGKFKAIQNMKYNITHKEKFYCEFDEFTENITENKLIRSCLLYLEKISKKEVNRQRIKELLFVFADVETSKNIRQDIQQTSTVNRLHSHYAESLQRAKIFLL